MSLLPKSPKVITNTPQILKINSHSPQFPKTPGAPILLIWYLGIILDFSCIAALKVSNGAKIRNLYNQVPHLTQDTNGKVTNSQLDITNESQEVSPFPAGDHKAHINRRTQRHSKHKTEQKHKRSTKEVPPWNVYWRA